MSSPRKFCFLSTIYLLKCILSQASSAFSVTRYTFDNLHHKCLYPIMIAQNDDNLITYTEMPKFIYELSQSNNIGDPLFNVKQYRDLPSRIIAKYNNLLCSGGCEGIGIDVSGVGDFDSLSQERKDFIERVCKELVVAMKKELGPSDKPSTAPSSIPTQSPTIISPSHRPSLGPTLSPIVPTPVTLPPSLSPSETPTIKKMDVAIPFGFLNMYGLSASDVVNNEIGAMQIVNDIFSEFAEEVEPLLFTQTIGNRKLRIESDKRHLYVEFDEEGYLVTNLEDVDCPQNLINEMKLLNRIESPKCIAMRGIIVYVATPPTNPSIAENLILARTEELIRKDKLRDKVPEELRDDYIFYSLTPSPTSVPFYAITGILVSAALVSLVAGAMLIKRKVGGKDRRGEQYDGLNGPMESGDMTIDDDDLGCKSGESRSPLSYMNGDDSHNRMQEMSIDHSVASSSNAGSSGWSSSAGVSSLNTASVDSAEYFGSSLAAIGAASIISKKYHRSPESNGEMYPVVSDMDQSSMSESDLGGSELDTDDDESNSGGRKQRQFAIREELDKAIKFGDWSLVGATAAIIAQSPNDFLATDINSPNSSGFNSSSFSNQRDMERATEMERLIEAGDWEGIVLAAAKFEAESDRDGVTEGSASTFEGNKFLTSRFQSDANSTNSPSVSTNISESASNNLKRAEIRAEVEALVRRVVPDEIDNVDEMMNQFRGREEELVETLRTMQERSIAARQREAMRKNAKREARRLAKQNKPPTCKRSVSGKEEFNQSFFSASSEVDNDSVSKLSTADDSNLTPNREALNYAIQMGDWEAVGRTAELLGERSVSGSSITEYHSADDRSIRSVSTHEVSPDVDRAMELEDLIDNGDWSGVVAAASRFTAADQRKNDAKDENVVKAEGNKVAEPLNQSQDSHLDDSQSHSTEMKKERTIEEEEEDALAQAEIWMTIAAQSKNENSNATGASEAADWAISRSLNQILASSDNVETQSIASSNDDKSV